jgi:(p)ppGpp synthase/HD superfamily hydrolase
MSILSIRFVEALVYALRLHRRQQRKLSGTPYSSHLMSVASITLEYGASEDEAIAALLHDAVEDQGGQSTYRTIHRRFGPAIAELVHECTDAYGEPKPPWRERKEAFLRRLASASASARLVKAADKLDNCRSLMRSYRQAGESVWTHFRGGRDGTLWDFHQTVEVLKRFPSHPLVEELGRAVRELECLVQGTP